MAAETPPTPLIGRRAEMRELGDLIGLGGTAGGAVLLGGDAGAGKSRLLAEISGQAAGAGWRVLAGHCLDFGDGSPPYLPFSEALGRLAADNSSEADSLLEASPALARLLPAQRLLTDRAETSEPTGRAALFDAVHGALQQLSGEVPLLLIVEDVHWADQSTRDLLRFLFARQFDAPIAVVASYRSDDLHRRHPLRAALAEWVRLPGVARLQIAPLGDDDARRLVQALRSGSMPGADLRHILARAEGNPFFIEELVAAAEVSGGQLPTDLADLLLVRLEQLDDNGRLAVRAASVAGRRVSHDLLARGTDLGDAALDTALRAAVEANVLVTPDGEGYAFRHALLAEAVYQDLLPGERVRLHAAYADAIASRAVAGSAAELSRHARASHDLVTATRASIQAGAEAMAVGGPDEATRHYELALELLAEPQVAAAVMGTGVDEADRIDRVGLVLRASTAATAAGHLFRALALVEDQLNALPDDAPMTDRVRLIYSLTSTALVVDSRIDILSLTTEAMRLMADEPPSALRAHVLNVHARANAQRARDDEAFRCATEALQVARELSLPEVAADATMTLARLDERAGDDAGAQASLLQAIDSARAANEPLSELRGMYNLATIHYGQGRLQESLDLYRQAARTAGAMGRQWAPYGLDAFVMAATVANVRGDWSLAIAILDGAGVSPPEQADVMLTAVRLDIAAGRGEVDALAAMPKLRSWWTRDGLVAITSASAAIDLYGRLGDLDGAMTTHDDVVAEVSAMWQGDKFAARIRLAALLLGQLASGAATASAAERAEFAKRGDELAAVAEAVAASVRHMGPEGGAWAARASAEHARLRWLAGGDAAAEPAAAMVDAWRQAVSAMETFGHVYETARSRARLATALHAAGRTAEAAEEATLARTTATRLLAQPLLEELDAISGPPPAPAAPLKSRAGETLTAREREVLVLVATGRSNRDIAGQLFISAKTVSVHISNVMAKLEAASRTEAVAIARRRDLLG